MPGQDRQAPERVSQNLLSRLGFTPPRTIIAGSDGMLHHGVHDDNPGLREMFALQRQMLITETVGVQQEGMSRMRGKNDKLVHDPAWRADKLILRSTAKDGHLFDRHRRLGMGQKRHHGSDLNRGG